MPSRENEIPTIWLRFSGETQNKIKECSLINVIDENKDFKKIWASLVADIFACDCLYEQKLSGMLATLTENLSHEDSAIIKIRLLDPRISLMNSSSREDYQFD